VTPRWAPVGLGLGVAALVAWLAVPALTSTGTREELPAAYAGRVNPRAADPVATASGAALFQDNCTSCHGERADGRGPAAVGLTPPPADLRWGDVLARHSDAYLYYRLSEGKPGTAMPAFRGALDEQERWAVVAYLRSLRRGEGAAR
jgi:mono/diheme cytochrome c family protein